MSSNFLSLAQEWKSHLICVFQLFHDIINNNIQNNIDIATYIMCLDIIEFLTRNLGSNELMYKHGEITFEMLVKIEHNLKQNDWDKYVIYETEINEIFDNIGCNHQFYILSNRLATRKLGICL